MTEDKLVAAISLPIWFPPVRVGERPLHGLGLRHRRQPRGGDRRGADELWVIWTVSKQGRWQPGPVNQYFTMIEAAANSRMRASLDRIEANNKAIEAGGDGEFGRPITVRMLSAEVPVHYLLAFSGDRLAECVELGVRAGRAWCQTRGDHSGIVRCSRLSRTRSQ